MLFDCTDEFVDVLKREIDARKTHPRDAVDGVESFHDEFADLFGRDLCRERFGEVALDAREDIALFFEADGPLLACTS